MDARILIVTFLVSVLKITATHSVLSGENYLQFQSNSNSYGHLNTASPAPQKLDDELEKKYEELNSLSGMLEHIQDSLTKYGEKEEHLDPDKEDLRKDFLENTIENIALEKTVLDRQIENFKERVDSTLKRCAEEKKTLIENAKQILSSSVKKLPIPHPVINTEEDKIAAEQVFNILESKKLSTDKVMDALTEVYAKMIYDEVLSSANDTSTIQSVQPRSLIGTMFNGIAGFFGFPKDNVLRRSLPRTLKYDGDKFSLTDNEGRGNKVFSFRNFEHIVKFFLYGWLKSFSFLSEVPVSTQTKILSRILHEIFSIFRVRKNTEEINFYDLINNFIFALDVACGALGYSPESPIRRLLEVIQGIVNNDDEIVGSFKKDIKDITRGLFNDFKGYLEKKIGLVDSGLIKPFLEEVQYIVQNIITTKELVVDYPLASLFSMVKEIISKVVGIILGGAFAPFQMLRPTLKAAIDETYVKFGGELSIISNNIIEKSAEVVIDIERYLKMLIRAVSIACQTFFENIVGATPSLLGSYLDKIHTIVLSTLDTALEKMYFDKRAHSRTIISIIQGYMEDHSDLSPADKVHKATGQIAKSLSKGLKHFTEYNNSSRFGLMNYFAEQVSDAVICARPSLLPGPTVLIAGLINFKEKVLTCLLDLLFEDLRPLIRQFLHMAPEKLENYVGGLSMPVKWILDTILEAFDVVLSQVFPDAVEADSRSLKISRVITYNISEVIHSDDEKEETCSKKCAMLCSKAYAEKAFTAKGVWRTQPESDDKEIYNLLLPTIFSGSYSHLKPVQGVKAIHPTLIKQTSSNLEGVQEEDGEENIPISILLEEEGGILDNSPFNPRSTQPKKIPYILTPGEDANLSKEEAVIIDNPPVNFPLVQQEPNGDSEETVPISILLGEKTSAENLYPVTIPQSTLPENSAPTAIEDSPLLLDFPDSNPNSKPILQFPQPDLIQQEPSALFPPEMSFVDKDEGDDISTGSLLGEEAALDKILPVIGHESVSPGNVNNVEHPQPLSAEQKPLDLATPLQPTLPEASLYVEPFDKFKIPFSSLIQPQPEEDHVNSESSLPTSVLPENPSDSKPINEVPVMHPVFIKQNSQELSSPETTSPEDEEEPDMDTSSPYSMEELESELPLYSANMDVNDTEFQDLAPQVTLPEDTPALNHSGNKILYANLTERELYRLPSTKESPDNVYSEETIPISVLLGENDETGTFTPESSPDWKPLEESILLHPALIEQKPQKPAFTEIGSMDEVSKKILPTHILLDEGALDGNVVDKDTKFLTPVPPFILSEGIADFEPSENTLPTATSMKKEVNPAPLSHLMDEVQTEILLAATTTDKNVVDRDIDLQTPVPPLVLSKDIPSSNPSENNKILHMNIIQNRPSGSVPEENYDNEDSEEVVPVSVLLGEENDIGNSPLAGSPDMQSREDNPLLHPTLTEQRPQKMIFRRVMSVGEVPREAPPSPILLEKGGPTHQPAPSSHFMEDVEKEILLAATPHDAVEKNSEFRPVLPFIFPEGIPAPEHSENGKFLQMDLTQSRPHGSASKGTPSSEETLPASILLGEEDQIDNPAPEDTPDLKLFKDDTPIHADLIDHTPQKIIFRKVTSMRVVPKKSSATPVLLEKVVPADHPASSSHLMEEVEKEILSAAAQHDMVENDTEFQPTVPPFVFPEGVPAPEPFEGARFVQVNMTQARPYGSTFKTIDSEETVPASILLGKEDQIDYSAQEDSPDLKLFKDDTLILDGSAPGSHLMREMNKETLPSATIHDIDLQTSGPPLVLPKDAPSSEPSKTKKIIHIDIIQQEPQEPVSKYKSTNYEDSEEIVPASVILGEEDDIGNSTVEDSPDLQSREDNPLLHPALIEQGPQKMMFRTKVSMAEVPKEIPATPILLDKGTPTQHPASSSNLMEQVEKEILSAAALHDVVENDTEFQPPVPPFVFSEGIPAPEPSEVDLTQTKPYGSTFKTVDSEEAVPASILLGEEDEIDSSAPEDSPDLKLLEDNTPLHPDFTEEKPQKIIFTEINSVENIPKRTMPTSILLEKETPPDNSAPGSHLMREMNKGTLSAATLHDEDVVDSDMDLQASGPPLVLPKDIPSPEPSKTKKIIHIDIVQEEPHGSVSKTPNNEGSEEMVPASVLLGEGDDIDSSTPEESPHLKLQQENIVLRPTLIEQQPQKMIYRTKAFMNEAPKLAPATPILLEKEAPTDHPPSSPNLMEEVEKEILSAAALHDVVENDTEFQPPVPPFVFPEGIPAPEPSENAEFVQIDLTHTKPYRSASKGRTSKTTDSEEAVPLSILLGEEDQMDILAPKDFPDQKHIEGDSPIYPGSSEQTPQEIIFTETTSVGKVPKGKIPTSILLEKETPPSKGALSAATIHAENVVNSDIDLQTSGSPLVRPKVVPSSKPSKKRKIVHIDIIEEEPHGSVSKDNSSNNEDSEEMIPASVLLDEEGDIDSSTLEESADLKLLEHNTPLHPTLYKQRPQKMIFREITSMDEVPKEAPVTPIFLDKGAPTNHPAPSSHLMEEVEKEILSAAATLHDVVEEDTEKGASTDSPVPESHLMREVKNGILSTAVLHDENITDTDTVPPVVLSKDISSSKPSKNTTIIHIHIIQNEPDGSATKEISSNNGDSEEIDSPSVILAREDENFTPENAPLQKFPRDNRLFEPALTDNPIPSSHIMKEVKSDILSAATPQSADKNNDVSSSEFPISKSTLLDSSTSPSFREIMQDIFSSAALQAELVDNNATDIQFPMEYDLYDTFPIQTDTEDKSKSSHYSRKNVKLTAGERPSTSEHSPENLVKHQRKVVISSKTITVTSKRTAPRDKTATPSSLQDLEVSPISADSTGSHENYGFPHELMHSLKDIEPPKRISTNEHQNVARRFKRSHSISMGTEAEVSNLPPPYKFRQKFLDQDNIVKNKFSSQLVGSASDNATPVGKSGSENQNGAQRFQQSYSMPLESKAESPASADPYRFRQSLPIYENQDSIDKSKPSSKLLDSVRDTATPAEKAGEENQNEVKSSPMGTETEISNPRAPHTFREQLVMVKSQDNTEQGTSSGRLFYSKSDTTTSVEETENGNQNAPYPIPMKAEAEVDNSSVTYRFTPEFLVYMNRDNIDESRSSSQSFGPVNDTSTPVGKTENYNYNGTQRSGQSYSIPVGTEAKISSSPAPYGFKQELLMNQGNIDKSNSSNNSFDSVNPAGKTENEIQNGKQSYPTPSGTEAEISYRFRQKLLMHENQDGIDRSKYSSGVLDSVSDIATPAEETANEDQNGAQHSKQSYSIPSGTEDKTPNTPLPYKFRQKLLMHANQDSLDRSDTSSHLLDSVDNITATDDLTEKYQDVAERSELYDPIGKVTEAGIPNFPAAYRFSKKLLTYKNRDDIDQNRSPNFYQQLLEKLLDNENNSTTTWKIERHYVKAPVTHQEGKQKQLDSLNRFPDSLLTLLEMTTAEDEKVTPSLDNAHQEHPRDMKQNKQENLLKHLDDDETSELLSKFLEWMKLSGHTKSPYRVKYTKVTTIHEQPNEVKHWPGIHLLPDSQSPPSGITPLDSQVSSPSRIHTATHPVATGSRLKDYADPGSESNERFISNVPEKQLESDEINTRMELDEEQEGLPSPIPKSRRMGLRKPVYFGIPPHRY